MSSSTGITSRQKKIDRSGIWRPQSTDNFNLKTLIGYKKFFETDLKLAQDYLKYVNRFSKLPGFQAIKARAQRDVEISKINLEKVNTLIKIHQRKNKQ